MLEEAQTLYRARDVAQGLLKTSYLSTMKEYARHIQRVAELKRCGELEAVREMSQRADDTLVTILLLAAYVELVEPTKIN